MKGLYIIPLFFFVGPVWASIPIQSLSHEMNNIVEPLWTSAVYHDFLNHHHVAEVSAAAPLPPVQVEKVPIPVEKDSYFIGMGIRSVYIEATPKIVAAVANDPRFYHLLYGLEKPAARERPADDTNFQAHIYKKISGVENQDYILEFKGHWENDAWIQRAKLVKDEHDFALREHIKIIEPSGTGAVFREVSLFYPRRWWARLFENQIRKITARELAKLSVALKCASEKVARGTSMSDEIAKACYKESNR